MSEHEARRLLTLVSKIMAEDARVNARRGGKPGVARVPALPNFASSRELPRPGSANAGGPAPQGSEFAGVPPIRPSFERASEPIRPTSPSSAGPAPHSPASAPGPALPTSPTGGGPARQSSPGSGSGGGYSAVADPWWRKFLADQARCQYRDTAGRQCRMARAPGDPTYCIRHASVRGRALQDPETAGDTDTRIRLEEELMGRLENLRSATAINFVLGRLLLLKAVGIVGRQDAAVIAYICQLLLQSLPMVKQELASADAPEKDREHLGRLLDTTSQLFPTPRESDDAPPEPETGGESPSNE